VKFIPRYVLAAAILFLPGVSGAAEPEPAGVEEVSVVRYRPHTGSIRWQGRRYNLVLTVVQSEVTLAVIGFPTPADVRLTVIAADGQPMPDDFPLPRLSLEHRSRFLRPTLAREAVSSLVVPSSHTYNGSVGLPWASHTRMTARISFADRRRTVLTKIKNVLLTFPNPLAAGG